MVVVVVIDINFDTVVINDSAAFCCSPFGALSSSDIFIDSQVIC